MSFEEKKNVSINLEFNDLRVNVGTDAYGKEVLSVVAYNSETNLYDSVEKYLTQRSIDLLQDKIKKDYGTK